MILNRFFVFILLVTFSSCQQKFITLFQRGQYIELNKVVEIPFTIENGLIVIEIEIKGENYRFLLDTGAPNAISKELADKLSIEKKKCYKTVDSQGNHLDLDYVKVENIKIGDAQFTNTTAAIADFNQIDAIACLNIDGLIGANLMKKAYWQIDNKNGIIRIASDVNKLIRSSDENSIPFTTNISGSPYLNLKIGKTEIKRLTLDTGSVGFLSTSSDYYKELKETDQIKAERTSFGVSSVGLFGASKDDTIKQVLIDDFSLGDLSLSNQIIELKNAKSSLLGMSFLRNYLITIDWSSNMLYLSPQTSLTNLYAESFGISLFKKEEKLVVAMVTEGSSAETAGMKVGDVILRVNDLDVENTSLDEYCTIIRLIRLKEADSLQITVEREGIKDEYLLTKMPLLTDKSNL